MGHLQMNPLLHTYVYFQNISSEELHFSEDWFHGKLERDSARDRLMELDPMEDGTFLVRDSTTFVGDFSLSFV